MKGNVSITIQNNRTKYEFIIRRNLTIIRGDSATGKTTLIDMIRDYNMLGEESGIELSCDRPCIVIEGNRWKEQLFGIEKSIVFIDEGNRFTTSTDFAETIKKTDNYYVIVTREGLPNLPYSVEEIYGIRSKGKYGGLRQIYHEIFRIYNSSNISYDIIPDKIITEDSNSGFQFFNEVCSQSNIQCVSSNGKSNICKTILQNRDISLFIIADGAAFGSEMEKVMELVRTLKNVILYLPESFEWLILKANILNDKQIVSMSKDWGQYIDSKDFFSWEQFFTYLLIEKTAGTYLQYSKKNLNSAYLNDSVKAKLLNELKQINFGIDKD